MLSGTGVDTLHVYAFPNPGSGAARRSSSAWRRSAWRVPTSAPPTARATARPATQLTVDRAALGLAPGVYNIAVVSHSAVSGTFNNVAVVRVTLQ